MSKLTNGHVTEDIPAVEGFDNIIACNNTNAAECTFGVKVLDDDIVSPSKCPYCKILVLEP